MTKKYSVQVENDEVVSVEVDGVSYTDPAAIPDKQDRKKIKALISRTAGSDPEDGSDEAFDREFKKEFTEMNKQTAVFPKLLFVIFLGIAIIMFVITAFSGVNALQTMSQEKSTPGQVVSLVVHASRDKDTGEVIEYTYPVVEYTPPNQLMLRVQMSEGASPPEYAVGDLVTVLYDPQQVRNSRIKSFSSDLLMWILPGITFLVGAGFGTASVVIFRVWPPNKKD